MKKTFYIFLSILCLVFIFFNSSQDGNISNIRSNNMIEKVIIDESTNDSNSNKFSDMHINRKEFNLVIRKFAHGFEFGILAIILFKSFSFFVLNKKNIIIYSLFLVLICAVGDEFFQLYIPGRNSSVKDIVIDFIGGIIGILIVNIVFRIKCKYTGYFTKNKMTLL